MSRLVSPELRLEVVSSLNKKRIERGRRCIAAHKKQVPNLRWDPQEDDLIDAGADICHFIHKRGVDVETILRIAKGHFEKEEYH